MGAQPLRRTVEAFVQGDAAPVEEVVQWCRRGPRTAEVTGVERVQAAPDPDLAGFERRPSA